GRAHVLLLCDATKVAIAADVTLNLAVSHIRQAKKPTIAVDANLAAPVLAEHLGLAPTPGLWDVLAGHASLQRVIQETGVEHLHALPAGRVLPGHTAHAGSEAMNAVLRHLRIRYDWVLVSGPRWQSRPEVIALGACVDALYLVAREAAAST